MHLRRPLKSLPSCRDPISICPLRLSHKAKCIQTATVIRPSFHHNICSMGTIKCIMLIRVLEASCLVGTRNQTTHHLRRPPSTGNVPPYSFQQPAQSGRHGPHPSNGGHSQHISNGYSPMGPPPGYYPRQDNFPNQGPGADNFARRQMISFGPPDSYSPSQTPLGFENQRLAAYDPTTPHSFQGSQSSAPNEQEPAFYSQHPTAVISNGSNGHIEEVRVYQQQHQQPKPKPRTGSQVLTSVTANTNFPGQPMAPPPMMDHLDGLVNYVQAQFADSETGRLYA